LRENDPNGIVSKQFYLEEYNKAKGSSADEVRFRTDYLTQFVGTAQTWIEPTRWERCKADFQEEDLLENDGVVGGVDLAMRGDLCAYVVIIKKDDLYYILPRAFSPAQLAKQREKTDHIPLRQWSENSDYHVYLTDGDVIDPSFIQQVIMDDQKKFGQHPVRYDPWGAELFRQQLEASGAEMIEVSQVPASMSPPTGFYERLILDERIRIKHNPCYDWCLSNCVVRIDNYQRVTVDKVRSKSRIDLVVATIIGLTAFMEGDKEAEWQGSWVSVM
jgi:phage terminase large subunit-like protein